MQRIFVAVVLVTLLTLFAAGCSMMKSALSDPEWSDNYALESACDVPKLNDGSMYSTATTLMPEYVRGRQADDSRFTNATITLKESKDVKRIVVRRRSEDAAPLDIDILAMVDGDWKSIKEVRGTVGSENPKGNDIDIRLSTVTDKIRVRVQRAIRTADGKAAITKSPRSGETRGRGRSAELERVLQEPVVLAEIEIYGVKAAEGS